MTRDFGRLWAGVSLCCFALVLGVAVPAAAQQLNCESGTWAQVPGGGITNGTGPAAMEVNGNLYLYVTGMNDGVFENVYTPGSGWSGWNEIPGGLRTGTAPTAARFFSTGYRLVAAVDIRGHFKYNLAYKNQGWLGWVDVGDGKGIGTGIAANLADGYPDPSQEKLRLFIKGTDGNIYTNTWPFGGWTEVPGGGITTHAPAAANIGPQVMLEVRGVEGGIHLNVYDFFTGNWSGWTQRPGGGYTTAAPAFSAVHSPVLEVITVKGRVLQQKTGDNAWTPIPWNGRAATAAPAAIYYNGEFRIFVTTSTDRVFCTAVAP